MNNTSTLQWINSIEHALWQEESTELIHKLPVDLQKIMSDKGSLTTALKALSNDTFEVRVIQQQIGMPYPSEVHKLGVSSASDFTIREVELLIHDTAVVYARSVIPNDLTARSETGLANLGSKPLGHLLFKDGKMRKSRREFTCLENIYGRRTPYEYEGGTILVNEFFLGSLNKFLKRERS